MGSQSQPSPTSVPSPVTTSEPSAAVAKMRAAEAEITAALKGPMTNLERALLVADRKDIRAAIAKALGPSAQDTSHAHVEGPGKHSK